MAAAVTKGEMAAAQQSLAREVVALLLARNRELEDRLVALQADRDDYLGRFHEAEKEARALAERVNGLRERAELMSRFDWLLTFIIALAGLVAGFGISWPDLPIWARVIITLAGLAAVVLPARFKLSHSK
jgi:hypothetical protein